MTHYRWAVIGLGFLAIIVTYLDRMALSFAIGPLESLYHLSNANFGEIAAAFGVGYLVMTVGGGVLVDHFGARKIWSFSAVAWSFACALIGLATGYWWLFICRLLLGVAEGPGFPALNRVVADWLPTAERARALAFGLAAVPFASVIGAPLISYLVTVLGWRIAFFILGGLGIIWACIWYKSFRDQPPKSSYVSRDELLYIQDNLQQESTLFNSKVPIQHKQHTTWKFMLFNPSLLVNNYAFFAFGYLLFFALTWLPGFLEQTYAIKLKQVGFFLVGPWLLATLLLLLGGLFSDWIWEKTQSIRAARSHIIWACQILSALCFIPVVLFHSLTIALIFITLGLGIGLMPNAAFYAINTDLARDRAATSLGIMDCAFAAAGILAPLITGILSNWSGNFDAAIYLMIGLTVSSALAIILFQRPDKKLTDKS